VKGRVRGAEVQRAESERVGRSEGQRQRVRGCISVMRFKDKQTRRLETCHTTPYRPIELYIKQYLISHLLVPIEQIHLGSVAHNQLS
jgi:hypothetical protein